MLLSPSLRFHAYFLLWCLLFGLISAELEEQSGATDGTSSTAPTTEEFGISATAPSDTEDTSPNESASSAVGGGLCQPTTAIFTRAVEDSAKYIEASKEWQLPFNLTNVNFASLGGALKYVMTETIDAEAGYRECYRKNNVSYIQFYEFTYCNPNAVLCYFSSGKHAGTNFGEFGAFVSFDGGSCHNDGPLCKALEGKDPQVPLLSSFIGWQNQTTDPRNPSKGSYWYSASGECPSKTWKDKTPQCKSEFPTGLCPAGVTPDGVHCSYTYAMKGQVKIDDLVGITQLANPSTGKKYTSAHEFCESGQHEFVRDPKTYQFLKGLPFWKDPLNVNANSQRIDQLVAFYATDSRNLPLPTAEALAAQNPNCGTSAPNCYNAKTKESICTRDDQLMCVPCKAVGETHPWSTCGKPVKDVPKTCDTTEAYVSVDGTSSRKETATDQPLSSGTNSEALSVVVVGGVFSVAALLV